MRRLCFVLINSVLLDRLCLDRVVTICAEDLLFRPPAPVAVYGCYYGTGKQSLSWSSIDRQGRVVETMGGDSLHEL